MANSFVRYTGNGSTSTYSIPFSYRSTADLSATVAGVNTTFTLNAAGTTLTFASPPANLAAIEIRRKTSQTSRLTDYASGSVLTESDLDTDSTQAFMMSQEAIDNADDVIKISNTDFQYDATSKQIRNVTDPTSAQDVATKAYTDSILTTNDQVLLMIDDNYLTLDGSINFQDNSVDVLTDLEKAEIQLINIMQRNQN